MVVSSPQSASRPGAGSAGGSPAPYESAQSGPGGPPRRRTVETATCSETCRGPARTSFARRYCSQLRPRQKVAGRFSLLSGTAGGGPYDPTTVEAPPLRGQTRRRRRQNLMRVGDGASPARHRARTSLKPRSSSSLRRRSTNRPLSVALVSASCTSASSTCTPPRSSL